MMSFTRALAASAVLCFAIDPAVAQYNIFGTLTDVYVNGVPESLASVRQFEERCQTRIEAGEWWVDDTGRLGRVGGPAIYNADSCPSRPPKRDDVAHRNGMMSPTITR